MTYSFLREVNDDTIHVHIENFLPPFRTDRRERPGGGVIVCVRDSFPYKRRTDFEIRGVEALLLEVISSKISHIFF